MADYLSKYTGQEIDKILSSVANKMESTNVSTSLDDQDKEMTASAYLTYTINTDLQKVKTDISRNVLRTDQGEQTVNGKKSFASAIQANGGIVIPTGKVITIADEPKNDTEGVNLAFSRKHGVSSDSTPKESGLNISSLDNGYNKFVVDFSNMTPYSGSAAPEYLSILNKGVSTTWSMGSLFTAIFADDRFGAYVKLVNYNSDMLALDARVTTNANAINTKVNTTDYTAKMTALDAADAARVLTTTYTAGMATKVDLTTYNKDMLALDSRITTNTNNIALKVNTADYNTKMTALDAADAARVLTSTYTAGMANKVDTSTYTAGMATKVDVSSYTSDMLKVVKLTKTNSSTLSVAASGSATVDFTMANLSVVLVVAVWGSLVDTYRVSQTADGTILAEKIIQKSTAGTVTFAGSVVSGKLRLTISNANTSTAASIDYNLISSF